jgi:hypothetical protein
MSQELEILKTLANFVIFLISITIPTYAIAISLLGPEYTKMIERIRREKQNLEKELQEKAGTGPFRIEDLEKKIAEFHKKENKLKGRFNPLSLYPTVVFPNVFFGLSLFTILTGIYYFDAQVFFLWLSISLFFMALGLTILGRALTMIQRAARESG